MCMYCGRALHIVSAKQLCLNTMCKLFRIPQVKLEESVS